MSNFGLKSLLDFPAVLVASGLLSKAVWPYLASLVIAVIGLPRTFKAAREYFEPADKLIQFGPAFFAIPMAVFGTDHFLEARFVAQIVPAWMPWHLFWVYFVGIALFAAALSLATGVEATLAATLLGIMIFSFVLLIFLPDCFKTHFEKIFVTLLLRESTLSSAVLAFAASRTHWRGSNVVITAARFIVATAMAVYGVDHFLNPLTAPGIPQDDPTYIVTMPSWVPAHPFWAYATGAILIFCASAIALGKHARLAATAIGATVLVLIFLVYIPLTISRLSDVDKGLNYLAIHFALAGAALSLAGALPKNAPKQVNVAVREA